MKLLFSSLLMVFCIPLAGQSSDGLTFVDVYAGEPCVYYWCPNWAGTGTACQDADVMLICGRDTLRGVSPKLGSGAPLRFSGLRAGSVCKVVLSKPGFTVDEKTFTLPKEGYNCMPMIRRKDGKVLHVNADRTMEYK